MYLLARIAVTRSSLPPVSAAMSTGPACVVIPGKRWSLASCRAAAAASSALDGTHPVFTHVPPMVPRSIITTDASASRAVIAAANAALPDPVIARSYRMIVPSRSARRRARAGR